MRRSATVALTLSLIGASNIAQAQPVAPPDESFCGGCAVVAGGVALMLGSIPLFALGERTLRREEGASHALRTWDCEAVPGACGAISAAETSATPYFVAGGILAGVGLVGVATGAILTWQVPSTGSAQLTLKPQLAGAELSVSF